MYANGQGDARRRNGYYVDDEQSEHRTMMPSHIDQPQAAVGEEDRFFALTPGDPRSRRGAATSGSRDVPVGPI
jgi:hypothetical protein